MRAWRRPTLPHLEVQYHWRRGFSRPSSGWDRVFGPSLWPPGRQSRPSECRPVFLPEPAPGLNRGAGLAGGAPGVCHVSEQGSVCGAARVLPLCAAAWDQGQSSD